MSIAPLKSRRSIERSATGHGLTVVGTSLPAPVDAPSEVLWTPSTVSFSRRALSAVDPGLNERISGAQQAIEFLDGLAAQLAELRGHLSMQLAQAKSGGSNAGAADTPMEPTVLDTQIQRFNEFWLGRTAATAGTLDSQLGFSAPGEARQRFTMRGLNMDSLRAHGSPETLYFSVGGKGQPAASSVAIEPALSNAALVHRFDRALAPSGIRARQDAQGVLSFSVLESAWPNVRDTLAVMGEGRRFSTGRFNQLRLVAEAPVLRPEEWGTTDIAALRQTRQDVFKAQGVVRQARLVVAQALADAGDQLEGQGAPTGPAASEAAAWCTEFTKIFEGAAGRSDYLAMSSITSALMGISRQCVMTVLSPPAD
ncbi:MAG: hypothetical protein ACLQO1_10235 [Steroidobacteraceae bacterium]